MMNAEILAISASLDKHALTLSSQSSFTAKLLGLRSCIMGKDEHIDCISENYFEFAPFFFNTHGINITNKSHPVELKSCHGRNDLNYIDYKGVYTSSGADETIKPNLQ